MQSGWSLCCEYTCSIFQHGDRSQIMHFQVFAAIAKELGRDEVAVATMFYGQARASTEDISKLSSYLSINHATLESQLSGFPGRGKSVEMPPKEPLIYRLYEITGSQHFGTRRRWCFDGSRGLDGSFPVRGRPGHLRLFRHPQERYMGKAMQRPRQPHMPKSYWT